MFIINEDLLLADTLEGVTTQLDRKLTEAEKKFVIQYMPKLINRMFDSQSYSIEYLSETIDNLEI